jgi:hypothetical protein
MSMEMNNDFGCYIRRSGPQGWVRSRDHHRAAFEVFLQNENENGVRVSVPHMDGGMFVATFRRVNDEVCQYEDEYGARVDIMMCSSGHAAFINRVIDHY